MLNDEHPVSLELASLRAAVARFQEESHTSALKLQRFSLDTSNTHDKLIRLERENALLLGEIDILRRNATVESHTSQATQVQELTLSLRRLSDKLDFTEESLLERTTELAHANSQLAKAKLASDGAYALAARVRGREEEGLIRQRDLEHKLWESREQTKQSDRVVNEYANLVRSFEGRTSGSSPSNDLAGGRVALEKLFSEFALENAKLHAEIERLKFELEVSRAECEVQIQNSAKDRVELAQIRTEIAKLKLEDNSAANMVSRYMKFSQSSTNSLQESLVAMKNRHSATVDTLSTQISTLTAQLHHSHSSAEKMRLALDELGGDLMREMYGRRRETALRIRMVSREEGFDEWMHRWIRRAEERGELARMIEDAKNLQMIILRGSDERMIVVEAALQTLLDDLRIQTERRLQLEKMLVIPQPKQLPETPIPSPLVDQHEFTPSESSSSFPLVVSDSVVFLTKDAEIPLIIPDHSIHSLPRAFPPMDEELPTLAIITSREDQTLSVDTPSIEIPPPSVTSATTTHVLFDTLSKVKGRYDDIQRSFRDCHLALQDLKQAMQDANPILKTATERLNDYTEDARVELEIRVADESLQTQGFETLLSIGNVSAEVEAQVEAFINGNDASVKKAQKSLEQKLEDIEHDIAAIKRALHDPELLTPVTSPPLRPSSPGSTFGSVMTTRKLKHTQSTNFASKSNPYAALGLKIAMPQMRQSTNPIQTPRVRTMSALYTLGLGSRNASQGSLNGRHVPPIRKQPDTAEAEDDIE